MKNAGFFFLGMLASFGVMSAFELGRHRLARHAVDEAIQQDVESLRKVLGE